MMPLVLVSHDATGISVSETFAHCIINGTIIFLGQDDRCEVQYDFLSHMIPLALTSASCDASSIVSGPTALLRSR